MRQSEYMPIHALLVVKLFICCSGTIYLNYHSRQAYSKGFSYEYSSSHLGLNDLAFAQFSGGLGNIVASFHEATRPRDQLFLGAVRLGR